jgi:hypothetical protein
MIVAKTQRAGAFLVRDMYRPVQLTLTRPFVGAAAVRIRAKNSYGVRTARRLV